MDTIQDVTAQCPQDLALVKKYINQVQSAILKIQQDENITDLQFVDYLELNELKCKKCHYLNFNSVPKKLSKLILTQSYFKNLTGLKQMIQLTELNINVCRIYDISELNYLRNLTKLSLETNNIKDISALKDLKLLTELNLNQNNIKSIQALKFLTKLLNLQFADNFVEDIFQIRNCFIFLKK
ncbi:leucine-rich_repeat domain-containing protein [Hexamita inflata]|uniref:Partial n=1 Tax=Hexamita inflata TaxID=28002 RepID=A0AA86Q245_9EUKA|nr:leucine-rich repeat domain-containing protein [Hexamita inflata]